MKIIIKSVQIISIILGVVVILTIVAPMIFGIMPYVVLSGSMEPEIKTGAVAYVNTKVKPEEIKEGDIISFKLKGIGVTHRVAKVNDDKTFTTKGDANNTEDPEPVTYVDYKGKTVFSIPYLGNIISQIKTTPGACAIGVIIIINVVFLFIEKRYD